VATIGVFDGVHRGHEALLQAVRERAAAEGAATAAVTFDPPPEAILAPRDEPFEITPGAAKQALLTAAGIERLVLLRFSAELAALSPEAFLEEVLLAAFDLRVIVVGYDFRFGAGGAGDAGRLRALGAAHRFAVDEVPAVRVGGEIVSSTRIRELLRRGAVGEAAAMLGRPFAIRGPVTAGRGLGGTALVPTANLTPEPRQLLPADGVYLGEAEWEGGIRPALAMVGASPTLEAQPARRIEVHLLDFEGDLRGRALAFRFQERRRGPRRCADLAELRSAIDADLAWARERIARPPAGAPGAGKPARDGGPRRAGEAAPPG
jgi:riboflavin kinase/FMN adenylyltransferase